jgi:hypothetical protein
MKFVVNDQVVLSKPLEGPLTLAPLACVAGVVPSAPWRPQSC